MWAPVQIWIDICTSIILVILNLPPQEHHGFYAIKKNSPLYQKQKKEKLTSKNKNQESLLKG